MSTAIWPPISPEALAVEEKASLARELLWLLKSLQETLASLKSGLDEVAELLAPSEHGSTLVVSTHRSESLKGFVTRIGARIVKGSIQIRLPTLPPPRGASAYTLTISTEAQAPTIMLNQLTAARTSLNSCLDVVDASAWAGDPGNADFIAGQLRLLDMNLQDAKAALTGGTDTHLPWYKNEHHEKSFNPPLPSNISFHVYISDANIIVELRTLELQPTGQSDFASAFGFRDRIGFALGTSRQPIHDEVDDIFTWRGHDAKVKEKVRVESSDPQLMAALAKLNSLERTVGLARKGLSTVMEQDD